MDHDDFDGDDDHDVDLATAMAKTMMMALIIAPVYDDMISLGLRRGGA